MERDRRLSLTVGGLVLASLGAFAVVILSLSAERGVWRSRYRLVAYFENVQGLIAGAPVWLAGKRVGRVESVRFGTPRAPGAAPAVQVVLQVDDEVRQWLRSDSVASIGTMGLLGDRYIEVSMGTAEGEELPDRGELHTIDPVDYNVVLAKGATAVDSVTGTLDNIATLAENLNATVENFQQAQGGKKLADSISAVGEIVREVREGDGLLHSLIYGRYEGVGVESIERSLATLESILSEVRHGKGLLHTLIYEEPAEQDVVMQVLQAGARLNSILAKIDRGDGSLGLLVNDPTLYEELKLLVGGANRSAVVRGMIRMISTDGGE